MRWIWLTAVMMLCLVVAGCGGDATETTDSDGKTAIPPKGAEVANLGDRPGRPAIPEPIERGNAVEGLTISPFFDAEGTVLEKSVGVGEIFSLYICATHPNYTSASAQWRLEVPKGIEVLGETKVFDRSLSLGTYDTMFIVTYPCQTSGETVSIMKYNCIATKEFAGGEFTTVKASSTIGHDPEPPFIGFVSCGDHPEQVPSSGGTAIVTLK